MAKDVVVRLKLEKTGMIKSLQDVKAGFDMVLGAAQKFGRHLDDAMERAHKYTQLQRANTLSINEAAKATEGYLTKMTLLKSANMAAGFQLGLTADQFALIAKNAVMLGKAMGVDAEEGMEKFIKGLAMGRKALIDDLGITVNLNEAKKEYAREMGIVGRQLTDAESKQAFMNAALKDMKNKADGATLSAGNASDQYVILKNRTTDLVDELLNLATSLDGDTTRMQIWSKGLKYASDMVGLFTGNMTKLTTESLAALDAVIGVWGAIMDPTGTSNLAGKLRATSTRRAGAQEYAQANEWAMTAMNDTVGQAQRLAALYGTKQPGKRGSKAGSGAEGAPGRQSYLAGMGIVEKAEAGFKKHDEWAQTMGAEKDPERIAVEKKVKAYHDLWDVKVKNQLQDIKTTDTMLAFVEAQEKKIATLKTAKAEIRDMTEGALASLTAGLWEAADASIMGSESFGMAMAKMLKSTLLSVATQATVLGMLEMAKYVASWFTAGAHLQAAGMFFATAAVAGGAGLAVSAGIKSAGGYDKKKREEGQRADSTYKPAFGSRSDSTKKPVVVNVYFGAPDDPAAALIATQRVQQAVAQAA